MTMLSGNTLFINVIFNFKCFESGNAISSGIFSAVCGELVGFDSSVDLTEVERLLVCP